MMGCATTASNGSRDTIAPVDLRNDKALVKNYWVLSKESFPRYPVAAARNNLNGCVNFELLIDSDGKPRDIKVLKSDPDKLFVTEARNALKKNRWSPSELNTSLQPVLMTFQWDFSLDGVSQIRDCNVNDV
jgi:TonB family protein